MTRAGVDAVARPTVLGLAEGTVNAGGHPAWSYVASLVWIVPAPDVLKLFVRPSAEPVQTASTQDIPADGLPRGPHLRGLRDRFDSEEPLDASVTVVSGPTSRCRSRTGTASARAGASGSPWDASTRP